MDGDPENEATFKQVQFLDGFVKHQNADVNMHFGTYVADYQAGMPEVSSQNEKVTQTDPVEEQDDRGDLTKADFQSMIELLEEMLQKEKSRTEALENEIYQLKEKVEGAKNIN